MNNILSLFDWMSCWQQAIDNYGIKNYNYFASEIDKYAIQVTKDNYPNTIHIWSVVDVNWKDYKNIEVLNALVAGYFLGLGYDVYDWETSNMVWSVLDMIDWNKEKYGKDGEFQIHVLPRKFTL
jgi:hypothetical protein